METPKLSTNALTVFLIASAFAVNFVHVLPPEWQPYGAAGLGTLVSLASLFHIPFPK